MSLVPVSDVNEIKVIDTEMFGLKRNTSAFLIDDEEKMLIDTGISLTVGNIFSGLAEAGVSPDELDYIFVTHVHLDHVGGLPQVLQKCGSAEVLCHRNSYKYITDEENAEWLVGRVKEAMGPLGDMYGDFSAVPENRCSVVEDGDIVGLGGLEVEVLHTPGHAPHHVSLFERTTDSLFVIDEGCAYMEGEEFPTTPPSDFDYDLTLESLERFRDLGPDRLLYGHFGVNTDGVAAVDRHVEALDKWVELIRYASEQYEEDEEIVDFVMEKVGDDLDNDVVYQILRRDVYGVLGYLRTG